MVTFAPAARYEVPSISFVNEPDRPRVAPNEPVTPTLPEKLAPEIVATIESLIASVTSPVAPPPVRPVPAVTDVISPTVPSFVITTWPFDEDAMLIPEPATRYEVPSERCVKDPDMFETVKESVDLLKEKLESPPKDPPSLN